MLSAESEEQYSVLLCLIAFTDMIAITKGIQMILSGLICELESSSSSELESVFHRIGSFPRRHQSLEEKASYIARKLCME